MVKALVLTLSALFGAIWIDGAILWLRPLTAPNYRAGEDYALWRLLLIGLVLGSILGASAVLWLPKLPKGMRYLVVLLPILTALYCFNVYSRNMHFLNNKLLASIQAKDISGVDYCLEHGADVNVTNAAGLTPLMMALNQGDCEMVQDLLTWFPNVNKQDAIRVQSVCAGKYYSSPNLLN